MSIAITLKNDLFVWIFPIKLNRRNNRRGLQEMRRRYIVLTPGPVHIFFHLILSPKHRLWVMKKFFVSEIPSQLTIAKSTNSWFSVSVLHWNCCKMVSVGVTTVAANNLVTLFFNTLFAKTVISWRCLWTRPHGFHPNLFKRSWKIARSVTAECEIRYFGKKAARYWMGLWLHFWFKRRRLCDEETER